MGDVRCQSIRLLKLSATSTPENANFFGMLCQSIRLLKLSATCGKDKSGALTAEVSVNQVVEA